MKEEISFFSRINWATTGLKTITVNDAIEIIRKGDYFIDDTFRSGMSGTLKEITEQMQRLPYGTDLQAIKLQFLPAVSFNGVWDNGIKEYSNFTALDFDHIPSQEIFTQLYQRLMNESCVRNIYRTPSGHGLKALILHDNINPELHGNLYQQLMGKFWSPTIGSDPKCKDLSRRNYLCYDPNVWTNPRPAPFHFVYNPQLIPNNEVGHTITNTLKSLRLTKSGDISDASIMYMLKSRCKRLKPQYLQEGFRRDGVYWFGTQAAKAGVDYDYALDFVNTLYQSNEIKLINGGMFSEKEVKENFSNGYETEEYDEEYRNKFKKMV